MTTFENHASFRLANLAWRLLDQGELMRIPRALALIAPALTAVLATLSLAFPSPAVAQTQGGISITLVSVSQNGTEIRDMGDNTFATRGYNAAECAVSDSITTEFTVTNLPTGTTFVDAWLGNGTQDCSTETARQTGNGRVCVHLEADPTVTTNSVTLSLTEMLDPDDSACDSTPNTGATYTLWFFATGSTETTSTVTSAQYGYVSFRMDVVAPAVPTPTATSLSGGESVRISWGALAAETNPNYRIFIDDTVMTCDGAGQYMAGDPAPATADQEGTPATQNVSLTGLAEGASAMVFVSAVDQSENESVLSAGVCVTRVPTVGFCEALEGSGQPCTNSCVAGAPGSRPVRETWWFAVAVAALALRRRSRR
jgi:MYXO-CTERM domain-containing protein